MLNPNNDALEPAPCSENYCRLRVRILSLCHLCFLAVRLSRFQLVRLVVDCHAPCRGPVTRASSWVRRVFRASFAQSQLQNPADRSGSFAQSSLFRSSFCESSIGSHSTAGKTRCAGVNFRGSASSSTSTCQYALNSHFTCLKLTPTASSAV